MEPNWPFLGAKSDILCELTVCCELSLLYHHDGVKGGGVTRADFLLSPRHISGEIHGFHS